ncbi:MAG: NAD(P)H-binding protein [bacterium]|nr:NAD(P)H-binding protein [bacterium]
MVIALIGATGFVGSSILSELLHRGHHVTALLRDPSRLTTHEHLRAVQADVQNEGDVARAVAKHDAVVSAFNPGWDNPKIYGDYLSGTRAIIDGVKAAGLSRLLTIGGAGSLFVAPGVQGLDRPDFTGKYRPGAMAARDAYVLLSHEPSLAWTVLSPPPQLEPGERTGIFRIGGDDVLVGADGTSRITTADLAVAVVNELETPAHVRRRFTVAY